MSLVFFLMLISEIPTQCHQYWCSYGHPALRSITAAVVSQFHRSVAVRFYTFSLVVNSLYASLTASKTRLAMYLCSLVRFTLWSGCTTSMALRYCSFTC